MGRRRGLALGADYVGGVLWAGRDRRPRPSLARPWLALLTAGWAALALSSPEFVWLAFPLFFLYLHLLPLPAALPGVVLLTAAAVGAVAWHGGGVTLAEVLGPTIGASVATLMALAYQALYRESEERRLLIEDLVRTREKLVEVESEAARLTERERLAREIHDTLAQGCPASSCSCGPRAAISAATPAPRWPGWPRPSRPPRRTWRRPATSCGRWLRPRCSSPPSPTRCAGSPSRRPRVPRPGCVSRCRGSRRAAGRLRGGAPAHRPGALGNAVSHSGAENVRVTLTYLDDMVMLDVFDDGRGFDPAAVGRPPAGPGKEPHGGGTGYGLRAMRDRAAALGGTLTVESAPQEGTAVAATLPMPGDGERG